MKPKQIASLLVKSGYRVVPIVAKSKRPAVSGFQRMHASLDDVDKWFRKDRSIGILAENTPAVDIDITDKGVSAALGEWVADVFGDAPVRIGRAPKQLLVFRTDQPFRKHKVVYEDDFGDAQSVEVLATGQFFVAYGIHAGTGQPYTYPRDDLLEVDADALPLLRETDISAIFDKFETLAQDAGWAFVSRTGERGSDDEFENLKPKSDATLDEIKDLLSRIGDYDDYDRYLKVGMALHHQFDGSHEGLNLWRVWAKQSSKYDQADLTKKYDSFGVGATTLATLFHFAKEDDKVRSDKAFEIAARRLMTAPTIRAVETVNLGELAKAATTQLQFEQACKAVQMRIQELDANNTKPRLDVVRDMLKKASPQSVVSTSMPPWCEGWVFVTHFAQFYHPASGQKLSKMAFDSAFGRETSDDRFDPSPVKASDMALNVYQVPLVYDYMYLPGGSEFIEMCGKTFINTFNIRSVPEARPPSSEKEEAAVMRARKHIEKLFPFDRDILLDYLSYNIQRPEEKIKWAIVIQGVDGGGKSWLAGLMAATLGQNNVRSIPGARMKEKYTEWAENSKMIFIEEIRIRGREKYDVLDQMKMVVESDIAPIRRMGTDGYEVPNRTNYIAYTNYMDAMPINANDRRYAVLRTSFQTQSHIRAFNAANPNYFAQLFNDLATHAEVLRHWLATRPIGDSFNAKGHAPHTQAKTLMREASESDSDSMIELESALSASSGPPLSNELLSLDALKDLMAFSGVPTRTIGTLLARAGFSPLGRFRVGDSRQMFYTRHSELFAGDGGERDRETILELLHGF